MVKSSNSVTFILGENIFNESFKDAFHACYFIENMPYQLKSSTINNRELDEEQTMEMVKKVGASGYVKSLGPEIPVSYQELLGAIIWYQDMYDADQLRKAEKEVYNNQFSTQYDF